MKYLLYLTATGAQLWCRDRAGWHLAAGLADGPVWVLTNLPEESLAEIQVPRVFGRDRTDFLTRQLANQFPQTPFRTLLAAYPAGGLMDRLAPPRRTLMGLDAAQKVDAALDSLSAPIAGLWPMSMLLAHIGCKKSLPSALFVVLPGADALRIIYIKNHVPVLSRLIPGVSRPSEQAAEIIRTLRHLENTRVIERTGQQHPLLLLGEAEDLPALLRADRLDLIAPPAPWGKLPASDWLFALFDLALTSPAGQMAPLSRRTQYVANRMRAPAYAGAALCLALGLLAAADNLRNGVADYSKRSQIQDHAQLLTTQLAAAEQQMAGFGVPAELVRSAVALDQAEVESAPSLALQMQQIAQVIGQHDATRLERFDWRILSAGQAACTRGGATTASPAEPAAPDPAAKRLVEVSLELILAANQGERARFQTIVNLSSLMRKINGATLLQDPARELGQEVLSGGVARQQEGSAKALVWCLTLPGVRAAPASHTNPTVNSQS